MTQTVMSIVLNIFLVEIVGTLVVGLLGCIILKNLNVPSKIIYAFKRVIHKTILASSIFAIVIILFPGKYIAITSIKKIMDILGLMK